MRQIISGTTPQNFYCKKCQRATNIIFKEGGGTYCENCVKSIEELIIEDWRLNLSNLQGGD